MSDYVAPLKDMQFVLNELAGLDQLAKLPGCEDVSVELVEQILEESGKFCAEVLSPLNQPGDAEGSKWDQGKVTTPKGFIAAYKQFVEGGWNALAVPGRIRRPGSAQAGGDPGDGNVEVGQSVVFAVPAVDRRRHRGAALERHRPAQTDLPAENGRRQLDRHHEPDRAAGGLGPGAGQVEGSPPGRRATTTASPGRRYSSPMASTTWPRTSFTWCSRARPTHPRG